MTDYLGALRDALQDAAARQYPAGQNKPVALGLARRRSGSQNGRPARRFAWAAGAVTTTAAAATLAIVLFSASPSTPPAYALARHPDGSVTITVHNISTAARPLNARLAALGIPDRIVPITRTCGEIGPVMPIRRSRLTNLPWTYTLSKSRRWLAPGFWGYIAIGRSDSGQLLYAQGAMKPPLPSCFKNVVGMHIIAR
jgi:hypothetical protein